MFERDCTARYTFQHVAWTGVCSSDFRKTCQHELCYCCCLQILYCIWSWVDVKCAKMTTKKMFGPTFCTENYCIHFKSKHSFRCKDYQIHSKQNKLVYFDIALAFMNTIMSHLDQYTYHVIYIIDKVIIEFIIGVAMRSQRCWKPNLWQCHARVQT